MPDAPPTAFDETGRPMDFSRLEAMASLKARHDAVSQDKYEPPHSCLTAEEKAVLCSYAEQSPDGAFVEVGVYQGGSAYHLTHVAQKQHREIWLYDTFDGMPYSEPGVDTIPVGDIKADYQTVKKALGTYPYLIKCVFPMTDFLPQAPVAFVHVDCDQYKAIVDTCKALEPLMAPGGVMWFDDVVVLKGARQAVWSLYEKDRIKIEPKTKRWWVSF